jgi:chromosome partitioning protein
MVRIIFSPKGGTGKTTLAFHLAGLLAEEGKEVLLIDADKKQMSAQVWWEIRKEKRLKPSFRLVVSSPSKVRAFFDDAREVIIDLPGERTYDVEKAVWSVLDAGGEVIVPTSPSDLDTFELTPVAQTLMEYGKGARAKVVLNRAEKRAKTTKCFWEELKKGYAEEVEGGLFVPTEIVIPRRVAFERLPSGGKLVWEDKRGKELKDLFKVLLKGKG